MTSSILKPRSLAKNSSDLRIRLSFNIWVSRPYPAPPPEKDTGYIPFASTPNDSRISLFSSLSFLRCRLSSLFFVTVTPSDKSSVFTLSLNFLTSLVQGVVKWIDDRNSVSSPPTKNVMPCWVVFALCLLSSYNLPRAALPPSKNPFLLITVNIFRSYFSSDLDQQLEKSAKKFPFFVLVVVMSNISLFSFSFYIQVFSTFETCPTTHPHIPLNRVCIISNSIICI